jgi:alpha-tubulin suppressor-like RCC1 family protein
MGGIDVHQVAAGRAHTMAVDEQGRLWGWGSGVAGRLGTGCNLDESVPVLADTMQQAVVRAVACGHDYTLMLCDD